MALAVEFPERTKKLQELAGKFLEEKEGDFPARNQIKRLLKLALPDPYDPAMYLAPVGITKMGKENIWNAVNKGIEEGKNVYFGYHATRTPYKLVSEGVAPPYLLHEAYKGKGLFASPDPFLGIAQRSGSVYQNPKYFLGKKGQEGGIVRMVLTPEKTFTIEEPALKKVAGKYGIEEDIPARRAWDDVLRRLGDMTKLEKADLWVYPSKGTTEYIVRDPAAVSAMSWRGYTSPGGFPSIRPKSFEKMAEAQFAPPEKYIAEMYRDLHKAGRFEKGVREFGGPVPTEYAQRELGELIGKPRQWQTMEEILEDIIQGHQGELYKPVWGKKKAPPFELERGWKGSPKKFNPPMMKEGWELPQSIQSLEHMMDQLPASTVIKLQELAVSPEHLEKLIKLEIAGKNPSGMSPKFKGVPSSFESR